jgi:ribosomal protein S18 acetylase RimI-like enzyme
MIEYRGYSDEDYQFLREMLFEAVFWSFDTKPSFEEGLSLDYTKDVLTDFGNRENDLAVIALEDGEKVGCTFIRCWNKENEVRGWLSNAIPVLVIGVKEEYRSKGIGVGLIEFLKIKAADNNIDKISLCATKTNRAVGLYKKTGFKVVEDIGDSYNMIWESTRR